MKRKSALNRLIENDSIHLSEPQDKPVSADNSSELGASFDEAKVSPPRKTRRVKKNSNKHPLVSLDFKKEDDGEDISFDSPVEGEENKRKKNNVKAPSFKAVNKSKLSELSESDEHSNKDDNNTVNDETLDTEFLVQQDKYERAEKRGQLVRKIFTAIIIFGCVYIIFLIYGLLNTNYIYNDNGVVVAQKMTFEQIKAVEDFNKIASQYRQARILYERVLTLDYRIAAGVEDSLTVAPEYDVVLDDVEALVIQLQALDVPTKYSQIKNMLIAWVQTDVAVYCQRMSESISQNNSEYAQQAMQYRDVVYNDFSLITENIIALGQNIDGVVIDDIVSWSPESYVRDNIGAVN